MLFTEFRKYFFRLYNAAISSLTTRVTNLETPSTNPKVYKTLLSEAVEGTVTSSDLVNTVGDILWSPTEETGLYNGVKNGAFLEGKQFFIKDFSPSQWNNFQADLYRVDDNTIQLFLQSGNEPASLHTYGSAIQIGVEIYE